MNKKAYSADLIYTLNGTPIPKGVIEINDEGIITHIGENSSHHAIEIINLDGFICPGFINTHCHLELSHLKSKVPEKRQLHNFITDLQGVRLADESEIQSAIQLADEEMRKNGIVAVSDISNSSDTFQQKKNSSIVYHTFIELFGFNPSKADTVFDKGQSLANELKTLNLKHSIVPHSPYSVSEQLFSLLKKQTNNMPLSIHNQETASENEMFVHKTGKMVEMLENFGNDLSHWQATKKSSLQSYLQILPKEAPLLLVHNTFTNQADIQWAQSKHDQLYWCFCPNANLYIEHQLPDLNAFITEGVKCTLGTDSLASNWQLSIWEEIKTIKKFYSQIELETLLNWGCKNGAEFLGLSKKLGSLEVGKKPGLVSINNNELRIV